MVLSYQSLSKIITGAQPMILSAVDLDKLIQPASLDVPVGKKCYRVSVSVSPSKNRPVSSLLKRFSFYDFEVKSEGAMLEKSMTYIIPLGIELSLANQFRATFSPKSTTGRNDVFVRVLTEDGEEFDQTSFGYSGMLYLEVTPLSFGIKIYPSQCLTQMRVEDGSNQILSDEELSILHSEHGIVRNEEGEPIPAVIENGALYLHLNLASRKTPIGYASVENPESIAHTGVKGKDSKNKFWRELLLSEHNDLTLTPNSFSLLYTKERIVIPSCVAATMQEYSVGMGEFRTHYAGFFDPGFGGDKGTYGVLEFRPHTLSVCLRDGQAVCRMVFYKVDQVPEMLYSAMGNYVHVGPNLPKNIEGSW